MPAFGRWPKLGLPGLKTCSRMLQLVRTGQMTLVDGKKKHWPMGKWIAARIEKKYLLKELLSTSKALRHHQTLHQKVIMVNIVLKKKIGRLQKENSKLQKKVVMKVRLDKKKELQKKVVTKVGFDKYIIKKVAKKEDLPKKVAARCHSGYWPNISLWPLDGLPGKSTLAILVNNARNNPDLMPYLEENTPTVWAHVRDLLEKNKGKEPGQRPGKSQAYVFLKQYQQDLITMEALQKKNAAIAKFVQQKTDFAQGQQYERYLRDMRPEYSVADNRESQEDTEFCAALSALESYAYVP